MRPRAAERYIYPSIADFDAADVGTLGIGSSRGHASCGPVCRGDAIVRIGIGDGNLAARGHIEAFGYLRADCVGLIGGYGERREDADDCDHNHQFDQRESLILLQYCQSPHPVGQFYSLQVAAKSVKKPRTMPGLYARLLKRDLCV